MDKRKKKGKRNWTSKKRRKKEVKNKNGEYNEELWEWKEN